GVGLRSRGQRLPWGFAMRIRGLAHLPVHDLAHNPFNLRPGQTNVVTITDAAAHVTVGWIPPARLAGSVTSGLGTYDFGVR
ncbi:MAG: hypothetical protein KGJ68_06000, partial [Gammaproteobacteria bacterium]|nr:hypothetical protein [Gammaproteobacteria bacterium]